MAKKYSKEQEQLLVSLYNDGKSPYWIVKNIDEFKGKRPSVIYDVLKRLGIKSHRPIKLTEKEISRRRKYDVNDNYFEHIDSSEKAYWLGFMLADGYILTNTNTIGLSLSVNDESHIVKFKECIQSDSPINRYKSNGFKETEFSRIQITSKKMKEDLTRHGVVSNKTYIVSFPYHINKIYYKDVIRGYIDGDGSITTTRKYKDGTTGYKISIEGTESMLESIKSILNVKHLKLQKRYKDRENTSLNLTINGNVQVLNILNSLYETSEMYLERKYDKYIELKQQTSCRPS